MWEGILTCRSSRFALASTVASLPSAAIPWSGPGLWQKGVVMGVDVAPIEKVEQHEHSDSPALTDAFLTDSDAAGWDPRADVAYGGV